MNARLAEETLTALRALGMDEICVCPGSRNAPWIQYLTKNQEKFRTYYFFEERSAAFFALGRIRATGRPVAVATTSGTAVAELLPATMEAHYSGLPLILLTADRPRRFRGTGAPQAAEHVGIFGQYCSECLDLEGGEKPTLPRKLTRPLHLNTCFEEPMKAALGPEVSTEKADVVADLAQFFEISKNPLVIVGTLAPGERAAVRDFLIKLGAPAYLEAPSGLRESPELERMRIHVAERLFERAEKAAYPVDGILRIGGVPTHRLWRDLEDRFTTLPVLSIAKLPFSGLARPSKVLAGEISRNFEGINVSRSPAQALHESDRMALRQLNALLESEPYSEPGLIHRLSKILPEKTQVFVGNSLPIREWDLTADWRDKGFEVLATRGVNGIDGQVSTFLGLCDPERPNWGLVGDLTALYDLTAPWALQQRAGLRVDLVVINNGGGKIFDRMYPQTEFQNSHTLRLEGWAALWRLHYIAANDVDPTWRNPPADGRSRIIELLPDEESSARFWKEFQKV